MRIGTTAMTGNPKSADSRVRVTAQHRSPWLNIAETKWNVPQWCEFEDCRKGPESEMDGAIARTGQSGDDSELTDGLTRREHDILAFERQWWKYAGSKEDAIKELFSMSATRYYQVLNALVDRPEALAADPMLVKRLRRLRASRQKARAARKLGFDVT